MTRKLKSKQAQAAGRSVDPAVHAYFEQCHRKVYPASSTIISAGDYSSALYYLISGSVSVVIEDENGHEMILAYLNSGDIFGEIGKFDEKHERSAWVRARTESEVAQVGYDRLQSMAQTSPTVVFALLTQLSRRILDTNQKLGDLAFKDVSRRIARVLLNLCEQPEALPRKDGIGLDITRQELARIVGCSRERVSRVLHSLEHHGVLTVEGKIVVIHNRGEWPARPA